MCYKLNEMLKRIFLVSFTPVVQFSRSRPRKKKRHIVSFSLHSDLLKTNQEELIYCKSYGLTGIIRHSSDSSGNVILRLQRLVTDSRSCNTSLLLFIYLLWCHKKLKKNNLWALLAEKAPRTSEWWIVTDGRRLVPRFTHFFYEKLTQ